MVLHRLRKKLAGSDVRIVTVRGLGYMLESVAAAPAEVTERRAGTARVPLPG